MAWLAHVASESPRRYAQPREFAHSGNEVIRSGSKPQTRGWTHSDRDPTQTGREPTQTGIRHHWDRAQAPLRPSTRIPTDSIRTLPQCQVFSCHGMEGHGCRNNSSQPAPLIMGFHRKALETFYEAEPLAVMRCHREACMSKNVVKSRPLPSCDGAASLTDTFPPLITGYHRKSRFTLLKPTHYHHAAA